MPWIGRKKLAFVPLYRSNAHPPDQIPPDWTNQILQRVFFDPDPKTNADRSLRAYIRAASSGVADLDAIVWEMQTIDQQDVPPDALEGQLGSQLRAVGVDAAAIVMLGEAGAGTSAGFWVRFVMAEGVGVWAMEFMHSLTGFGDLYPFNGNMGAFDEMACACGTHPSAYTKAAIQWLDEAFVAQVTAPVGLDLHSVGLVQPPPSGRSTAARIGSQVPYLMVEARQRVDQFDANIPSEGVIVYRVQTTDPLGHPQSNTAPVELLTTTALTPGTTFTADSGTTVAVNAAMPGGFSVFINVPDPNTSPWTSVSDGESTPGAPITAVVTGPNRVTLFLADPGGGIYTTTGSASTGWGPWTSVSQGQTTPGAPIAAVVTGPNRVMLFVADPGGGVYTVTGGPSGWGAWSSVSQGSTIPGGSVTAVVTGQNRVTLFLADSAGGVYTASGSDSAGWGPWSSVSQGSTAPGAPIAAVVTGPDRIALFLADPRGGVYAASGSGRAGWGPWTSVSQGSTTPGARIAAVMTGPDRLTLFLADPGGGVYTVTGSANAGWGSWSSVSQGSTTPGAPITAVAVGPDRIALFLADPNGGIYSSSGNASTGWGLWTSVSQGRSMPGAPIGAVLTGPELVELFLADPAGGVYTATKKFQT